MAGGGPFRRQTSLLIMHLDTHLLPEPLPPPPRRPTVDKLGNAPTRRVPADGRRACARENFAPSGFGLSCLSEHSSGGTGALRHGARTSPSIDIGKLTTNVASVQILL